METGALGKDYQNGEISIRQGKTGDPMYLIEEEWVEILKGYLRDNLNANHGK